MICLFHSKKKGDSMKRFLIALAFGSSGGWIFSLVHVPLSWTLGPLVAVVVMKIGFNFSITWPAQIRNIAMVVLGYAMGRSFTPETGHHIHIDRCHTCFEWVACSPKKAVNRRHSPSNKQKFHRQLRRAKALFC